MSNENLTLQSDLTEIIKPVSFTSEVKCRADDSKHKVNFLLNFDCNLDKLKVACIKQVKITIKTKGGLYEKSADELKNHETIMINMSDLYNGTAKDGSTKKELAEAGKTLEAEARAEGLTTEEYKQFINDGAKARADAIAKWKTDRDAKTTK